METRGASGPPSARGRPWDAGERAALLAAVPPFSGLPPAAIRGVADRLRPRRVPRGAFVFLEGEPARTLNLAAEGRVKVVRETEEGRQVILRLINPGELFGASGGWGGARYPASARALDDAVVLQLPAREFADLIHARPELAMGVIAELGARLREAEARILDLQTGRVEPRIARALLRLARRPGGGPVLALSRQDIADLAGTTLTTASRTLSAWHRAGIVVAGRERVTLLDPGALAEISSEGDG